MNKTELIAAVARRTGHSRQAVADVLAGITETIQAEVSDGGEVAIQFFGSFKRKHTPARDGRHPQTGQPMRIGESWTVKFAPAAGLKTAVRGRARSQQSPVSAVA
ncbi:HU family DNA-binding protein [Nonomuraea rubra]|uniref:DNA-binding protein HU-beta n=1 Tax=Nonomuraea rubra TaxID=46180 RepID=A0A7X0U607_9ACTN|nr:HU family DNA-binding protein [Nonomuraea rubra]MBB6556109.1 DNA-binding protein HU-beta [Nonomuraea rubra]